MQSLTSKAWSPKFGFSLKFLSKVSKQASNSKESKQPGTPISIAVVSVWSDSGANTVKSILLEYSLRMPY